MAFTPSSAYEVCFTVPADSDVRLGPIAVGGDISPARGICYCRKGVSPPGDRPRYLTGRYRCGTERPRNALSRYRPPDRGGERGAAGARVRNCPFGCKFGGDGVRPGDDRIGVE